MQQLPVVYAVEYRRELPSGTTRPCVFLCESAEGQAEEYVTKMRHDVRSSGLGFEYIAYQLARHFQLDCPSAALVNISLDLAIAQNRNAELRERIIRNVGLNFGTVFLPGHSVWLPTQRLGVNLRQAAAEIVAFDGLIDNADRRSVKPNLLISPTAELVVIDHEVSFSFLRLIGASGPWLQRLQFLRTHPLYDGLQGKEIDLYAFRERLLALTDASIAAICSSVPPDFDFIYGDRVAEHLRSVRDEADVFIGAVEEVLQ